MKQDKFSRSEIAAAISEMNKKMEKTDQQIATLGKKMESIDKIVESRVAKKKNYGNEQKRLETEKDLLQVKTLRELCSKANIPVQDVFSAAFAALMEKAADESDEEIQEARQEAQATEKTAEDFGTKKSSAASDEIEQKNEEEQIVNYPDNESLRSQGDKGNNNLLSRSLEAPARKKEKGKPMSPLDKAKMEQQERLAKEQSKSPPKQQPAQKNSLEERLGPYLER